MGLRGLRKAKPGGRVGPIAQWVMGVLSVLGVGASIGAVQGAVRPLDDGPLPCSPESEFVAPSGAIWQGEPQKLPVVKSWKDERSPASVAASPQKSVHDLSLENETVARILDLTSDRDSVDPQREVCSRFNPEFGLRSGACCPKKQTISYDARGRVRRARGKGAACAPLRAKASYCGEMTPEQRDYWNGVESGEIPDVLAQIAQESRRNVQQSWCSVSDGFLAWGRPVLPTPANRLIVKNPERCVNFGTDPLVSMVEWSGREVAKKWDGPEYAGLRLVIGHLSAPRGGCIPGRRGGRGHSSHTSGVDVDLAFLDVKPNQPTSEIFGTRFSPEENWWLMRRMFENPYACVKVMFLDRRHIRTLARWLDRHGGDSDRKLWGQVARYVQHVKGHRNHLHIRVGDAPGAPGCVGMESTLPFELESSPEEAVEDVADNSAGEASDGQANDASAGATESSDVRETESAESELDHDGDDALVHEAFYEESLQEVFEALRQPAVRDVASKR